MAQCTKPAWPMRKAIICGIGTLMIFSQMTYAGPVMQIREAIKAGEYVAAGQILSRAYRKDPQNHVLRQFIQTKAEAFLNTAYDKAEMLSPTDPSGAITYLLALRTLGRQLFDDRVPIPRLGEWLKKVEETRDEKMTRFLDAAFERGKLAYDGGLYRTAHQHFQMLYKLRPDDQRIAYYYRLAYDKSRGTVWWGPFESLPASQVASAFSDAIFSQVLRQKSTYLTVHRLTTEDTGNAVTRVTGNIQVDPWVDGPCETLTLTVGITLPKGGSMASIQHYDDICQGDRLQAAAALVASRILAVIDRESP
jgi:hypothetical protein